MKINRTIRHQVENRMVPGKVVVLLGPRQVGKTTLLKEVLAKESAPFLFVSGEDRAVQTWLGSQSIETLRQNIGKHQLLVVDEAQHVPNIGLNLKLLIDHLPHLRILATGSSSFDLSNQTGEPLVGRKWEFELYPIAQLELAATEAPFQTEELLSQRLIYGSYPEIITTVGLSDKRELLNGIVNGYLYKDLLMFEEIRKSKKIVEILSLLAFQIGSLVSVHELSQATGMNTRTMEKYLDLLEKVFVIKRLGGYSRNLRKEISKGSKYYFWDNGIRNAIINNFNELNLRNDVGALWENYLIIERLKKQGYTKLFSNNYFWRTYDQKEVDFVEERDGRLYGFEFKWTSKSSLKPPSLWLETYPEATFEVIHPANYLSFIAGL
ncbi:ATP-binding protein [Runella aurantiaca]|uniref:ATP-binding protein n=1 Tax=Runella aurantiaca TaxID=2282308 RepID=A0A369IJ46_9BACT|nr:ATP-binding protein [Runella aurantiaca]RDB07413.1 ATP-binding protein [Runella aurantiaca]